MKKICFIATISKTIEWFLLEHAEYLANNNFDVYIVCNNDNTLKNKISNNITYIPVEMKRGIDFTAVKSIIQLIKVFKQYKFDVIQYTTPNASMYASLAGVITKIPHRIYRQWGMVYIGFSGIKHKIFKAIEKFICSCSTFILPDSFGNLEFCRENKFYSSSKSQVILNGSATGIDFSKFDISQKTKWKKEIREQYNLSDNDFVFGFIGRINKDKGITELLKSFKEFSQQFSAKLFLVGLLDGEDEIDADLFIWAKNSSNVIFVDVTDVAQKYYSAFDVFVLPSYREGFGSTIIEAEAMGIPVITTNIPGPSEAIKNNITGILVKPKDSISLTQAMIKLFNNPGLCVTMGNAGNQFVKSNFSRNDLFKANLEFLKYIINE